MGEWKKDVTPACNSSMQERLNSIANALVLRFSCTNHSISLGETARYCNHRAVSPSGNNMIETSLIVSGVGY